MNIMANGNVKISEENFPDKAFRNFVQHLSGGKDVLKKEVIQKTNTITLRGAEYAGIQSLKGIEAFSEVTCFDWERPSTSNEFNEHKNLDFSGLPKLAKLFLSWVKADTIDISKNDELREIDFSFCGWSTGYMDKIALLRPKLVRLKLVCCDLNNKLDFSACPDIESIYIADANLNRIVIPENAKIKKISLMNLFFLESVSKLESLHSLRELSIDCSGLKELEVEDCPDLMDICVGSNEFLEKVEITGCENLSSVIFSHTPKLKKALVNGITVGLSF